MSTEQRFDVLDVKIAALDAKIDVKTDALNTKFDVLLEEHRAEIRLVFELLGATNERMDRGFDEVRQEIRKTNEHLAFFIRTQGEANRQFRETFGLHEDRLNALDQRDSGA